MALSLGTEEREVSTRERSTKDSRYSITDGVYRTLGVKCISLSGFIYLDSFDSSRTATESPHIS